jgi:hypothetical protein
MNWKKKLKKVTRNVRKAVSKGVSDAGKTIGKGVSDGANVVEKGLRDGARTIEKAAQDIARTAEKAGQDTWTAAGKGARDTFDAAKVTARFLERQVATHARAAADAERRLREGKVLDMLWHLAVDPITGQEENLARATQESHLIRTVGQVAASVYGGPGGAAAYAAWYTYRATGDAEMAFRVGVITGATSVASGAAGDVPSDTARQLAGKVAISGAIGGLAVACAGGDADAIREGFLRSGAMVLVQDGYREFTKHPLDGAAATKEPLDLYALDNDLYVKNDFGDIMLDRSGRPMANYALVDRGHSFAGISWGDAANPGLLTEHSPLMTSVSRIPGMNAMALFHDQWVLSWEMNTSTNVATIPPAVVITYMGTDAPLLDHLRQVAMEAERKSAAPAAPAAAPARSRPDRRRAEPKERM